MKYCILILLVLHFSIMIVSAQVREENDIIEKVTTEEVKLNVVATDWNGKFVPDLKPEDIVISENHRLHQPISLRHLPASVMIVLDTSSELAYAKRNRVTAATAKTLLSSLHENDTVAVIQYADQVRRICDWTRDKTAASEAIDKQLAFGRRSMFYQALNTALEMFENSPPENRHLVLISDGISNSYDPALKESVEYKLLASDISVHVISYTQLQKQAINLPKQMRIGGIPKVIIPTCNVGPNCEKSIIFPILTVNLNRAMRSKKEHEMTALNNSEMYLTKLAEYMSGEIILPESEDEMIGSAGAVGRNIDSRYIATYIPKRLFSDKKSNDENKDEERIIEASSHRPGVQIYGTRKIVSVSRKR